MGARGEFVVSGDVDRYRDPYLSEFYRGVETALVHRTYGSLDQHTRLLAIHTRGIIF